MGVAVPSVRRLTVDDWRLNRDLRLEALTGHPGNFFTPLIEAQARSDDRWRAMLMGATLVSFGLFDGATPAGMAAIDRTDQDTATLAMSYIRPAWRGRGWSEVLFAARLAWAREGGVRRVLVSHRASNAPSARAIARHGFRRIDARPHQWPDGLVEDDVRYGLLFDRVPE